MGGTNAVDGIYKFGIIFLERSAGRSVEVLPSPEDQRILRDTDGLAGKADLSLCIVRPVAPDYLQARRDKLL